jgi:hypothetical protein
MSSFRKLLSVSAATLFAALCLSAPALAADAACQPGLDAILKMFTVPVHAYTTETLSGGKSRINESIYFNGVIYVNLNGKWIRSQMTTQDMLKKEQENIRTSTMTCRYLRDELVNGESAAIYVAHSENEYVKTDAQTWISKARGVPLRTDEDVDTGQGDKQHMSIRYEYGNVHAPAGVQ